MACSYILVLHTDNGSVNKTKYIIDIVQGLRETGYIVYLITTNNSIKYINDVPFKLVFSWVPRSIFGYYQEYLFALRSILLAIYACWSPPKCKSCLVICDGSTLTIPLLKLLTKTQDVKHSAMECACFQSADNIILPSNECQEFLTCVSIKNKLVLPPCIEVYLHSTCQVSCLQLPELNNFQHIFTVFGEYGQPNNLYMVLNAFIDLKQMLASALFNKTRIVFVGRCESEQEWEELSKFNNVILTQDVSISDKIYLYDTSDMKAIQSFLSHSLALIDVNENSLFNLMVLKAQNMGKPVICFNNGYHREIVLNEISGVFITKQTHSIRNSMHRFISRRHWAEQLGMEARRNIKSRFSMCTFIASVNFLASKSNVAKCNTFLPIKTCESFHLSRNSLPTMF